VYVQQNSNHLPAQDLRCAELLNSSYTWAVQLGRGIFIGVSFSSAGSGSLGSFHLFFFGVFITVDIDRVGYKESGDITVLNIWTLLEAFFNVSLRTTCFIYEAFFLVKSKTSRLGIVIPKCWIVRISKLLVLRLKEFCCNFVSV
jgi:hypothetical protein